MANNTVDVFFYGSYMNVDILMGMGIGQREYHVGQLAGYELTIGSSANVVKNGLARVFGIVFPLTHDELDTLYGREAQAKLGALYMPEPVLVMTANRQIMPSLCYVADEPVTGNPPTTYIETILSAARQYEFPQSYLQHVESFIREA